MLNFKTMNNAIIQLSVSKNLFILSYFFERYFQRDLLNGKTTKVLIAPSINSRKDVIFHHLLKH